MYRAIVSVNGKTSVVVSGATPAALGTEIGALIPQDPLGESVDLVYEVSGPITRRMVEKAEETDPEVGP